MMAIMLGRAPTDEIGDRIVVVVLVDMVDEVPVWNTTPVIVLPNRLM
jgi:hypothetical protein